MPCLLPGRASTLQPIEFSPWSRCPARCCPPTPPLHRDVGPGVQGSCHSRAREGLSDSGLGPDPSPRPLLPAPPARPGARPWRGKDTQLSVSGVFAAQTEAATLGQSCCSHGEHTERGRRERGVRWTTLGTAVHLPAQCVRGSPGPLPATQLQPILLGSSVPAFHC